MTDKLLLLAHLVARLAGKDYSMDYGRRFYDWLHPDAAPEETRSNEEVIAAILDKWDKMDAVGGDADGDSI